MRLIALALLFVGVVACVDDDDVQVIAHRGASWDAPEHTFASWDLALRHDADWLEFDLQQAADGQLVVLHDETLDRTARGPVDDCRGDVRSKTLRQLAGCDVGVWFNADHPDRASDAFIGARIPTFDEALARFAPRARLYIEIKNPDEAPGMIDSLLAALGQHGLLMPEAIRRRLLVQSFSAAALRELHSKAPRLRLVQLLDDPIPADSLDARFAAIAGYAVGVGPSRRIVSARFVERAHVAGLVVHPYTVNDSTVMVYMLGLGVDGMFTDRPDLIRRLVSR
ncbi:MAG: hypothetical protein KF709_08515 [Gemmatimonadaceae bacterium]|nr:hypothetical protein [Gemmatimonadaceae bacterium]